MPRVTKGGEAGRAHESVMFASARRRGQLLSGKHEVIGTMNSTHAMMWIKRRTPVGGGGEGTCYQGGVEGRARYGR